MAGSFRLLFVALILGATLSTPLSAEGATRAIRMDASGKLLAPLPQVDAGDRLAIVVEPTRDAQQLDRASFDLVWSCGAGDGHRAGRLVLQPTPTTFEAVIPAVCTRTAPGSVRWDLEARRARDLLAQRYLHEAARDLSWLNRTALLCLGRGDCASAGTAAFRKRRDASVQARIAAVNDVFDIVAGRPPADAARGAFEAVFAVPPSGPAIGPGVANGVRDGSEKGWEQLAARTAALFAPYAEVFADEAGDQLEALATAVDLVDALAASGDFSSSPDAADIAALIEEIGGPTITPTTPLETVRRLLLDGRNRVVARVEAQYLKPSVWLASGEQPVGYRQRVISIDVDGDADTPELPMNRLDRVWVALVNATHKEWTVSLTATAAEDEDLQALYPDAAFATRGELEGASGPVLEAPPVRLRTAQPLRRVILRDYGQQDGHTNLVFSATSADGDVTKTTRPFYVRRTWNIGFKTALVYSHIRNRQLEFLEDPSGRLIFQDGLPRTTSTQPDGQAEVVLGVAIHPYPMDLQDEARRPVWARFLPHLFVGWAPTDYQRLYAGGGFEPIKAVSVSVGVALGPRSVLQAPPLGYGTGWEIVERPSLGWWVGIAVDASLVARLAERRQTAPTMNFGSFLGGGKN